MSDPIDSIKSTPAIRYTERVTSVTGAPAIGPRHENESEELFEDKMDVAPFQHLQNAPDQIDISIEMIRALVNNELPEDAVKALEGFAPLGDLKNALENCDRVTQKSADFVTWQKSQTLTQALEFAAA